MHLGLTIIGIKLLKSNPVIRRCLADSRVSIFISGIVNIADGFIQIISLGHWCPCVSSKYLCLMMDIEMYLAREEKINAHSDI